MPTKLDTLWGEFITELSSTPPEAYVQIRKIFRDLTWEVPFSDWDGCSLKPENLGYAPNDSKMRQLKRNYLNEDELVRARDSLLSRSSKQQSCITARFGNQEKDSRSQGFCMQTITLNHISKPESGKPQFVVELYYRSTEIGQKFYADLMFLDEVIFPILLEGLPKPDVIRFKFSTLYLSSMFLPIAMQVLDVVEYLSTIKEADNKWFTRCVRVAVSKWLIEECGYNYRTRAKMHDVFRDYVIPRIKRNEIRTLQRITKK